MAEYLEVSLLNLNTSFSSEFLEAAFTHMSFVSFKFLVASVDVVMDDVKLNEGQKGFLMSHSLLKKKLRKLY